MNPVNMIEIQALMAGIQRSIGNVDFPPFTNRQACGTAFEVYVFGLFLAEAVNAGADTPSFFYRNRVPYPTARPFKFRRSASRLSTTDDYTYAELTFSAARKPKIPLEVHVGIYICGPSGERVQSDVCVLLKSEADFFRTNQYRDRRNKSPHFWPSGKGIIMSTECKYYGSDLTSEVIHEVIGRDYETDLAKTNLLVVTNTQSLLAENRVIGCFGPKAWRGSVFPNNPVGERVLRERIRDIFTDYMNDDANIQR